MTFTTAFYGRKNFASYSHKYAFTAVKIGKLKNVDKTQFTRHVSWQNV